MTAPAAATDGEVAEGLEPIAIVGMAVRVPGADSITRFWRNLLDGVESKTTFTLDEQRALGVLDVDVDDPDFVPQAFVVDGYRDLDAEVFGMTPREAAIADPAQRMMLEVAHTALQDAGIAPDAFDGDIGVYGGTGASGYLWSNLRANPTLWAGAGELGAAVANGTDYLCTNISYKLGLTGPSMTVTTACSSSLVAIHLACEALRNVECDAAIAGGVSLELPHGGGYVSERDFTSPDGSVRPFDADAHGTAWGSGAGAVVLRRLSDALADGDTVRAVILGNAVNNDGATKVGFSAPSVQGQSAVIGQALDVAGIDPASIGYVEAHGTGTALGDPIEIQSLTNAFRQRLDNPDAEPWCAIGSVKSNLGHLSQAAGVVSLIKAALVLQTGQVPPTVHYRTPNPAIDFQASPFYPTASVTACPDLGGARRAAVSSFGIGGTNAHLVLEQAPPTPTVAADDAGVTVPTAPYQLRLSANTDTALRATADQLAGHLREHPEIDLADVAHTLRHGRTDYRFRRVVSAADLPAAIEQLEGSYRAVAAEPAPVTFLFSGQGAQYPGMGSGLYATDAGFRRTVDECCDALVEPLGLDLRSLLLADRNDEAVAARLTETWLTQPALFTLEFALARFWIDRGLTPSLLIGHSIGEYAAATLAGVFTPGAAARLVATRGALMFGRPTGSMVAVQQGLADLEPLLTDGVEIAAVNGPRTTVVGGPADAVDRFLATLPAKVSTSRLRTSHAFHTASMEAICDDFAAAVAGAGPVAPSMTVLSNLTGAPLTDEQATDPGYWAEQLRSAVRFGDCVATALAAGPTQFVEVGPGRQLAGLARMQVGKGIPPVASLPGPHDDGSDAGAIGQACGALFVRGIDVQEPTRPTGRRIPLPTYPYERAQHWIEPEINLAAITAGVIAPAGASGTAAAEPARRGPSAEPGEWFSTPVWQQQGAATGATATERPLLLLTAGPRGADLVRHLTDAGPELRTVTAQDPLPADLPAGEVRLIDLRALEMAADGDGLEEFFGALTLVQQLAAAGRSVQLDLVSRAAEQVTGADVVAPGAALLAGISRCVPAELDALGVRRIDVDDHTDARVLAAELAAAPAGRFDEVSLRRERRWRRGFAAFDPTGRIGSAPAGCVITGGTGGIGITIAEDLVAAGSERILLLARTGLPAESAWDDVLEADANARTARTIAAVRRMRAAGADVRVAAVDVTDAPALSALLGRVDGDWGGIDLLVHAAGLPGGGMAELKTREQAMTVLAPKVLGTRALKAALSNVRVGTVALCSSVTGVVGDVGQVDYCAGNAYLDAEAAAGDWPARVVSINWGGWSGIGMAVETATDLTGPGARELDHPLLSRIGPGPGGNTLAVGRLSPQRHWVVDQHRIGGDPVLPGTGLLELARAAYAAAVDTTAYIPTNTATETAAGNDPATDPARAITLADVAFVQPLIVSGGGTQVRVQLDGAPQGWTDRPVDFRVTSLVDGREVLHAQGTVGTAAPLDQRRDVEALIAASSSKDAGGSGLFRGQGRDSVVTFGPRWDLLRRHWLTIDGELAELQDPAASEAEGWGLQPALLDVATAFSDRGEGSYLPLSYGEITVGGPLPDHLYSVLTYRGDAVDEVVAADLELVAPDGTLVVRIKEFTLRKLGDAAGSGAATQDSGGGSAGADVPVAGRISPAQGALAFRMVLAAVPGAQVVLDPTPVSELLADLRQPADPMPTADDRPTGSGDRDELITRLAAIFSAVLGVPDVGADDDFFSLGGNSLVAVQLIGQIRKAVGVRLPMRALFDAPGVADMAEQIVALQAQSRTSGTATNADARTGAAKGTAGIPGSADPIGGTGPNGSGDITTGSGAAGTETSIPRLARSGAGTEVSP